MEIEELCAKIESGDFLAAPQHEGDSSAIFSFSEQINKLGQGLDQISTELKNQVRQNHAALLSQASHAGRLEGSLYSVDVQMKKLVSHANDISSQVDDPFAVLEQQTGILTRIHDATYLMRQAGRFLDLYRQLKLVKSEFPKQALIFNELDVLLQADPQLSEIKCIRDEIVAVQASRKKIINLADKELMQGLVRREKKDVLNAVHILHNLGILESFFRDRLVTFVGDVKQAIKECFTAPETKITGESNQPQPLQKRSSGSGLRGHPGKTPTLTSNLNFRNKLWLALEWLFNEEIFDYAQQIEFLCECLKEDAGGGFLVVSVQQSSSSSTFDLKRIWWEKLGGLVKEAFGKAPAHILQCLQEGLPQLTAITKSFVQKLGLEYADVFSPSMYHALHPGYVEKCSATLKASLNNGVDIPTEEHLDQFMRLASAAMNAALVDDQLLALVVNVAISCNKELINRLEAHVKLGTDTTQIYDVPNSSQLQNITICNRIHHHKQNVRQFLSDVSVKHVQKQKSSATAFENLRKSLESGDKLTQTIVQQVMDAIKVSLCDILMSMHREPGLNTSQSTSPSLYMKELNDFVARVWAGHLHPFQDEEMKVACGKELTCRCIELFIRNSAILRPLTATGRNKLKIDALFLETAVKPMVAVGSGGSGGGGVGGVASVGKLYRTLRAFQSVIVMSVEELAEQSLDADTPVPAYIILLLMFGQAGNDLLSPHITAGWTNEKLIKWLDSHTGDRDRFELVSGALLKYRNDIRRKNLSQYDPVYPIISNCLEKAYQVRR